MRLSGPANYLLFRASNLSPASADTELAHQAVNEACGNTADILRRRIELRRAIRELMRDARETIASI
jgi:hypothetical protein